MDPPRNTMDPDEDEEFLELVNLIYFPRNRRRMTARVDYFELPDLVFLQRFRLSKEVVWYLID